MREVFLQRNVDMSRSDEGTPGELKTDRFECKTLELPFQLNKKKVSSIIPGSYICKLKKSPKFGIVYEVTGVKDRNEIKIHSLNFAGDKEKGFKSESEGCIGLGDSFSRLGGQLMLMNSKNTLAKFMEYMAGEDFILNIRS